MITEPLEKFTLAVSSQAPGANTNKMNMPNALASYLPPGSQTWLIMPINAGDRSMITNFVKYSETRQI
jgi:hypothetical protein